MAVELIKTVTLNAGTSPAEITLPELPSQAGVVYVCEGEHSDDIELVADPTATDGLDIPAGKRWRSGPYRAESSARPRWLYAATSTSVTLHVLRDDEASFRHGPLDGEVTIDDTDPIATNNHLPQQIVGEQNVSGVSTSGAAVNPSNNGAIGSVVDLHIENRGGENGEFRRAGASSGDGLKIPAGESLSLTDVNAGDGIHEVAARNNTTDFLIAIIERA